MTATLPVRPSATPATVTRQRVCPLCEATCGLDITYEPDTRRVHDIRGDREHVFSRGYVCPKAIGLDHIDRDPDRLRTPLIRRDGRHVEATWDEAFAEIDRRLTAVVEAHGRDAVAVYLGNPNVHNLA